MSKEISREEVAHVAELARLEISDEELAAMQAQLAGVLAHIDIMASVDTAAVEPTAQVTGLSDVTRADAVLPGLTPAQVLANAPDSRDGCLRVQAVFEDAR